ncbi:MAG: hypothetical protein A2991_00950 [Candidatus Terrybacteria bacterium RIFCSPLOWO2_01_FULL_58_14]|uniref:Copper type II ascorbate-dependent monooxygenase C-terminal domain-containing protein n=1 Tax=Candidatus Terrybacteria bacterium RIFCSPLOWO2_01_FULL_58_14 TaxID=1802369 RepID=A0A1G2PXP4_9BACT|nr:MAG: hypothetical protein A2991_00950 [Candidatus Terrybacteria bacterium RIFCSPLOWO2_01_FULL_58_14]
MKRSLIFLLGSAILGIALVLLLGRFPAPESIPFRDASPTAEEWALESAHVPLLTPHIHEYDPTDPDEALAQEDPAKALVFLHGRPADSEVATAQQDLWVKSFRVIVNNAPEKILCHAGLIRPDEAGPVCPQYRDELFATALPVTEPVVFPEPYGMFLPKGTPLQFSAFFHNPLPPFGPGGTYEDFSASVVMETVPGSAAARTPLEFVRLHIEDNLCAGAQGAVPAFTVPPATQHYERSGADAVAGDPSRYVFARDGRVVVWGAHLHPWEGGEKVTALLNGDPVAEFVPRYVGPDPWTWELPLQYPENLTVQAGDVLSISATYSNPNDEVWNGAHGMLGFWFTAL